MIVTGKKAKIKTYELNSMLNLLHEFYIKILYYVNNDFKHIGVKYRLNEHFTETAFSSFLFYHNNL